MPNPWGGVFGKPRGWSDPDTQVDVIATDPGALFPYGQGGYGRTGPWDPVGHTGDYETSPENIFMPVEKDGTNGAGPTTPRPNGDDWLQPRPQYPAQRDTSSASPWGMTGINRWKTTEPPVTGLPEGSRGPWNPQYKIPGYDPSKAVTITANMTDDQRNAANMFNYLNTAIPYLAPADLATTLAQMAQSATSLGPEYAEYARSLQSGYGSGTSWASNDTYGGSKWRLVQARNGLAASMVNDSATGLPDADEASIIGLLDALIQLMPEQGMPASRSQITAYNQMANDLLDNVPADYQGILENIIFPKTDVPGLNLNYGSSSGARSTYGNSGGSRSYGYVNPRYT